jgi:hypothetical protein
VVIAAEKLLPRPGITVRIADMAALAEEIMEVWHGGVIN